MPRLIDPEARRREIAEATWRLVHREGLDAVSVRNVAREAGLSTGSLRHVFGSQAELVGFAMSALGERLAQRVAALAPAATPLDAVADVLEQLLPLDAERRREAEVWLAFVARARVDPELQPHLELTDGALRAVVHESLAPLDPPDAELAAEELYALVDGLTLHAVLLPGRPSRETMRKIVRGHLERLAARR